MDNDLEIENAIREAIEEEKYRCKNIADNAMILDKGSDWNLACKFIADKIERGD